MINVTRKPITATSAEYTFKEMVKKEGVYLPLKCDDIRIIISRIGNFFVDSSLSIFQLDTVAWEKDYFIKVNEVITVNFS